MVLAEPTLPTLDEEPADYHSRLSLLMDVQTKVYAMSNVDLDTIRDITLTSSRMEARVGMVHNYGTRLPWAGVLSV